MADKVTLEQVEALAAQLTPAERVQLVERLSSALRSPAGGESAAGFDWMTIRGVAPGLLEGEDAQAWVSRTRREDDEHRERNLRKSR
jgi:hypothetical protein